MILPAHYNTHNKAMTHETVNGTIGGALMAAGGKILSIVTMGGIMTSTAELIYSATVSGVVGASVGFFATKALKAIWDRITGKKE